MEYSLAILILSIVEQGAAALQKARADAAQNAAWTPDQIKAFDDRLAAAIASPAWQPDPKQT